MNRLEKLDKLIRMLSSAVLFFVLLFFATSFFLALKGDLRLYMRLIAAIKAALSFCIGALLAIMLILFLCFILEGYLKYKSKTKKS